VKKKRYYKANQNFKGRGIKFYCSKPCMYLNSNRTPSVIVSCTNCKKEFLRQPCRIKKTLNNFCSRSCSATYNNTHKKHGTKRSKLEVYLEECLTSKYVELNFDFNKKDTINSELDIYIPSLRLAFELNGIYHYEPIHGTNKLSQIQNNDSRKFQACLEHNIELCIIDTSSLSYFKPANAEKYLDIICSIIEQKKQRPCAELNCSYTDENRVS
jgi:hypothetical protein